MTRIIDIRRISSFTPAYLFNMGQDGAWFDPSSLSTLFQDAEGTIPVTSAGDPVRLVLDRSQGLLKGTDLITNGTFDSDSDWAKGTGWTISGGVATHASGASSAIKQSAGISPDTLYECTVTVTGRTSGSIFWRIGGQTNVGIISTNGTFTKYLPSEATDAEVELFADSSFDGSIDNVIVREQLGNHLTAPSDAARPTYQTSGGLHWLDFDGVDDYLTAPVPWVTLTHMAAAAVEIPTIASDLYGSGGTAAPNALLQARTTVANKGRAHVWTSAGLSTVDFSVTEGAAGVVSQRASTTSFEGRFNLNAPVSTSMSGTLSSGQSLIVGDRSGTGADEFVGKYYGGVVTPGGVTDAAWEQTIRYLARKAGVTV